MRPVAINDFCAMSFISGVKYSPEGSSACFALTHADEKENKYISNIYTRKDGRIRQLTSGGKDRSFCYLDEDTILFQSSREESKEPSISSQFYKISLSGGEAVKAFTLPVPVSEVLPLKNGDLIVLATTFPGFEDLYKNDKKLADAYKKHCKDNEDYEEITQVPWWWNGGTFTRGAYTSLFRYEVKKNRLVRLTGTGLDISDVKLSADGRTVYYSQMDCSVPKPDYFSGETVFALELDTMKTRCIASSRSDFIINSYEPGESFILLLANDGRFGMNTDPDFYTVSYDTLQITPYADYGFSIGSSVGSDVRFGGGRSAKMVGDTYYFVSTRFDSAGLYKLENGHIDTVIDRAGSIDCFDIYGSSMLICALWDMNGQELYDERGKKLSSFNAKALRGRYIARPESLDFTTHGHEIHGFVLKPFGFEEGGKYPVILDIHGGPKTVYGPVFYHEMQYWAGLGYFVIFCNPTGSDGRGEFMNILGKYGTVDYEDIMAFCDAALEKYPEMDKDNFFETGGSYGGFMTNWIIGHTDRFRACASQRSISNWVSFYGVSDIGIGFAEDQCASSVWPSPEKLWWHSPMKYADRCKTPTLFIHSFEDYRCPIDQGYQMYSALIAHGVESKMVCFKGENHELSRSGKPKHRIRRLKEITDWFENHRKA